MRLAQIENGIVINVIEANERPDWAVDWPEAGEAAPGWSFADGAFSPPPPDPVAVPASVSIFQARTALRRAGIFDAAEAAVQASGDAEIQDAWVYATAFSRRSPTIAALASQLGLTDAQVDDLFRAAALITA